MKIADLLRMTVDKESSDLHLKVGSVPVLRIDGQLVPQKGMPAITEEAMKQAFQELTNDAHRSTFAAVMELDFTYHINDTGRFRINAYLQSGTISLACRPVRTGIPAIEQLGLPEVCRDLMMKRSGLIVVTGPTGCGKSTTLAAMLEYLNGKEKRKIITIEDPIEFVHRDNMCLFSQRELSTDTKSFANALKHVLRQDPDVILVGEMRDLETMSATLTAAETGHLVLTTLHTPSAPQAIDRFIDVFPPHQQQQARTQLSAALEGVIYQALVPRNDGCGRVPAVEVMLATSAVRNLIREGKTYQLRNTMQTGAQHGMQTLDQALLALCRDGIIDREEAVSHSAEADEMKKSLGIT